MTGHWLQWSRWAGEPVESDDSSLALEVVRRAQTPGVSSPPSPLPVWWWEQGRSFLKAWSLDRLRDIDFAAQNVVLGWGWGELLGVEENHC